MTSWFTYLKKQEKRSKKYIASLETRNQELVDTLIRVMDENDNLREQVKRLSVPSRPSLHY